LKVPIFLTHGTSDGIVGHEGTVNLFAKLTLQDKTLKLYEGSKHRTFDDINREEVVENIMHWLNKHTI